MNEHCYIKHCWGIYEHNNIVNSVRVDDWTTEWAIIASNAFAGRTLTGPSGSLEETAKQVISLLSCFLWKNGITWFAQKHIILPSSKKLDPGQWILSSCLKSSCILIKKSTNGKILYNIMLISIAYFLIKSISIKTNMIIHIVIWCLWICLLKKCYKCRSRKEEENVSPSNVIMVMKKK